jgi:hypothetical protein
MAVLNFQIEHQCRDQWCWAAVAASICGFYEDDPLPTQCELANQFLFPGQDCCQPGASEVCNIPYALDLVLNQLGHLVQPPQGVVAFEDLDLEVSQKQQPIALRIMFSDMVTAHFVVVVGSATDDTGNHVVKIADPSSAAGNMTTIAFSALGNDYRPGSTWDQTYFTAKKA